MFLAFLQLLTETSQFGESLCFCFSSNAPWNVEFHDMLKVWKT